MNKAIFIDKDGTLIRDVPYNVDPKKIVYTPGVYSFLRRAIRSGFKIIVVTNQSGVARGLFTEQKLKDVKAAVEEMLLKESINLTDLYYCPHHPDGTIRKYKTACTCRKPQQGMLLQAARDHDIELRASFMIGDILDDVEAGKRAGCTTILLEQGHETQWEMNKFRVPDLIVNDFQHLESIFHSVIHV